MCDAVHALAMLIRGSQVGCKKQQELAAAALRVWPPSLTCFVNLCCLEDGDLSQHLAMAHLIAACSKSLPEAAHATSCQAASVTAGAQALACLHCSGTQTSM